MDKCIRALSRLYWCAWHAVLDGTGYRRDVALDSNKIASSESWPYSAWTSGTSYGIRFYGELWPSLHECKEQAQLNPTMQSVSVQSNPDRHPAALIASKLYGDICRDSDGRPCAKLSLDTFCQCLWCAVLVRWCPTIVPLVLHLFFFPLVVEHFSSLRQCLSDSMEYLGLVLPTVRLDISLQPLFGLCPCDSFVDLSSGAH